MAFCCKHNRLFYLNIILKWQFFKILIQLYEYPIEKLKERKIFKGPMHAVALLLKEKKAGTGE